MSGWLMFVALTVLAGLALWRLRLPRSTREMLGAALLLAEPYAARKIDLPRLRIGQAQEERRAGMPRCQLCGTSPRNRAARRR